MRRGLNRIGWKLGNSRYRIVRIMESAVGVWLNDAYNNTLSLLIHPFLNLQYKIWVESNV